VCERESGIGGMDGWMDTQESGCETRVRGIASVKSSIFGSILSPAG